MSGNAMKWMLAILLGLTLLAPVATAEDAPKPPGDSQTEPRRPGLGGIGARLKENLDKLDLSPEQQDRIDAIFEEVKKQVEKLKAEGEQGDRQAMAEKLREIFGGVRARLADILTPEQQEKLRELSQQAGPRVPPPEIRPKRPEDDKPKADTLPEMKEPARKEAKDPEAKPPVMKDPAMTDDAPKRARDVAPAAVAPTGKTLIDVGQPAPEIALKGLNDKTVTLSTYKGRVVVVVFGSYSTPSFRQRIASLEKLAKDYSTKAVFLIVYTREAHALGEWEVERNKDEEISVEQPKSESDRKALANQAVSTLKITLPVLLDSMDDAVAKAYGLTPNGAVIIGRDGLVAGRQRWFEPIGLRQQLDSAVAVKNAK